MGAEDPLFSSIPRFQRTEGRAARTGGYIVYAAMSHQYVFDYHDGDISWCTARGLGQATAIVYGPLANGAISLMFEGVPNYPDASRFWQVCDKHKVNIFYTAPTAIRALMREGEAPVQKCKLDSLRLLGSVGEPINPEAWLWYHRVVGKHRCPIVDTWWQTETGGILISPLPGATALKPGSATPAVRHQPRSWRQRQSAGRRLRGNLCIDDSWRPKCWSTAMQALAETYFPPTGQVAPPATAAAAMPAAITGSPAASMTCSTSPATA
jgi:acetyl-CoA synthetase